MSASSLRPAGRCDAVGDCWAAPLITAPCNTVINLIASSCYVRNETNATSDGACEADGDDGPGEELDDVDSGEVQQW